MRTKLQAYAHTYRFAYARERAWNTEGFTTSTCTLTHTCACRLHVEHAQFRNLLKREDWRKTDNETTKATLRGFAATFRFTVGKCG